MALLLRDAIAGGAPPSVAILPMTPEEDPRRGGCQLWRSSRRPAHRMQRHGPGQPNARHRGRELTLPVRGPCVFGPRIGMSALTLCDERNAYDNTLLKRSPPARSRNGSWVVSAVRACAAMSTPRPHFPALAHWPGERAGRGDLWCPVRGGKERWGPSAVVTSVLPAALRKSPVAGSTPHPDLISLAGAGGSATGLSLRSSRAVKIFFWPRAAWGRLRRRCSFLAR